MNEFPTRSVALVTGGTRGIGRAISLALARKGYTVVANYRSRDDEASTTLTELRVHAPSSLTIKADVGRADEATMLIRQILDGYGRLDLLVNNVGTWLPKDFVDTTPQEWQATLDSNLSSAFYCIRVALPAMRAQRSGCIINIGAMNSEVFPSGDPYSPVFGVAKAAVALMVRNLARSEGPYGIRVNAIGPGVMWTPDYEMLAPEVRDRHIEHIPLRRLGRGEDIANAVLYLASDAADYVTGTILHVHGGLEH